MKQCTMSSSEQQNLEMIPEWKEQRALRLLPPAGGIPHRQFLDLSLNEVNRRTEHLRAPRWGTFTAPVFFSFLGKNIYDEHHSKCKAVDQCLSLKNVMKQGHNVNLGMNLCTSQQQGCW